MHLTSPLPLVHLMFNTTNGPGTWKASEVGRFHIESDEDRLNLGTIALDSGPPSFGVTKEEQQTVDCLIALPPLGRSASDKSVVTDTPGEAKAHDGTELALAMHSAQGKRSLPAISALSVAVIALVAGPAIVLVVYILALNRHHRHGLTLQTDANLAYILAASQAISTVVSLAVPVVITVHAYQLASDWLRASRDPESSSRPSPFQ